MEKFVNTPYRVVVSARHKSLINTLPQHVLAQGMNNNELEMDWEIVLALLDAWEREITLASLFPERPEWLDDDVAESLTTVLLDQGWPARSPHILKLRASGMVGKPAFKLVAEWVDSSGLPTGEPTQVERGIVYFADQIHCRLTLGQWRLIQLVVSSQTDNPFGTADAAQHWNMVYQWVSTIPTGDPGVKLDSFLTRERALRVSTIAPRFVQTPQGWQARPQLGQPSDVPVPPKDVDDYFYNTPPSQLGEKPLILPRTGTNKTRIVFDKRAEAALHQLRNVPNLTDEQVAVALTRPESVFGSDIDLSQFSERVCGLGPITKRVCPIVRETAGKQWIDWDFVPVDADETQHSGDNEPQSVGKLTPEIAHKLKEAMERAEQSQAGFIPHPVQKGVFLEVNEQLREAVQQTLNELSSEPKDHKAQRRTPQFGLQVKENLEYEEFNRASETLVPKRVQLPPPPHIHGNLMPHQQEGYEWLEQLNQSETTEAWRGALLADDMGLGKTLQVLAHLDLLGSRGRPGPHLLVAPVALITAWQEEAKKWFGHAFEPMLPIEGGTKVLPEDPAAAAARMAAQRLVLVSYESLRRKERVFQAVDWDTVIFDEAQKAKDPSTQVSRVLRTLKARFRLLVTGTPVENGLRELWALYDIVKPMLLGTLRDFNRDYISKAITGTPIDRQRVAEQLIRVISPRYYIRRMKHDVLKGKLPEMIHKPHHALLSDRQEGLYKDIIGSDESRNVSLDKLIRLFGVCAHPSMASSDQLLSTEDRAFPKAAKLLEILNEVSRNNEKVLIFANRKKIQRWIADLIERQYNVPVSIINSDVPSSRERYQQICDFEAADGFGAMVLAPRAAGVGLTICAANHVIHYTREWNPAVEQQATDRVYRIGQTRPVSVYTITTISNGGRTVEQVLDDLLREKRQLMNDFVIPLGGFELSPDEFATRMV